MSTPVVVNKFDEATPFTLQRLNDNFAAVVAAMNALALDTLLQFGATAGGSPTYMPVTGGSFLGAIDAPSMQIGPSTGPKNDVVHTGAAATGAVRGAVYQAAASANTAAAPGAAYVQAEMQAILTELRDLKTKLRNAGVLSA